MDFEEVTIKRKKVIWVELLCRSEEMIKDCNCQYTKKQMFNLFKEIIIIVSYIN